MHKRKVHLLVLFALLCQFFVGQSSSQASPLRQDPEPTPTAPSAEGSTQLYLPLISNGDNRQVDDAAQAPEPLPIQLKALTLIPGRDNLSALPDALKILQVPPDQVGYYIVQFQGPVEQAWKEQLTVSGAELIEYLPDFAFKVRMTPAQASQVAQLANVNWVNLFQPAYKLAPNLQREGIHLYTVRIEKGIMPLPVVEMLANLGVQVLSQQSDTLVIAADAALLAPIAQVLDVAWIDNFRLFEKHNEFGVGVILGANTVNNNGYDGSTQIAAVADTGLGSGTANGAHPDLPAGRITAIYNWPGVTDSCFTSIVDDGARDVDSGHGTHVALSVVGDGAASGQGKAAAPAARLVFQAVENWANVSFLCQILGGLPAAAYFLTGIPANLNDLFLQAYNAGARIHSNSWGSDAAGDYNANSAEADQFVWNHQDMVITFSAGNEGADTNNDGVVDNDSIGSPATAKNVITVGASENDRQGNYQCDTGLTYTSSDNYQQGQTCSSMGGNNILGTAGQRWGFNAEPLRSDPSGGNREQMASFSSRGPTDDGRIKPDLVAPGAWVLSGYSDFYQQGYDNDPVNPQNNAYQVDGWGIPINKFYKYFGGTSMSNPIAAGAATVVRDFYQKAYNHAASAALVKATLINSAVDLLDENNDGANDNDFSIPNMHEGWGRINLINATDGGHQYVDDVNGLSTNGAASYQFNLSTGGSPFKVSLVWSDYPSTESAAKNLVNDLDLVVTAPNGTIYQGNVFNSGWSQSGGNPDRTNNVENVYIQSAAAGAWSVQVSGFNIPNGPQPFALVVDGAFGTAPTATPTSTATATETPTNTPTATQTPTPTNTVANTPTATQTPTSTPINTPTETNTPVSSPTATSTPTGTPENTPTPTATNTPVNTPTLTATASAATMHVGDLDRTASSAGFYWRATVSITIHDAGENPVANATVSGAWSTGFGGGSSCQTNSAGQCTVNRPVIANGQNSITFTVNSVSHSSLTYQAGSNHDPDGDSNGTAIIIAKP